MAAIAITHRMGVPVDVIRKTLLEFRAVEHRIEFVEEIKGVAYFGAGMVSGITTTVYPYIAENLKSTGGVFTAAAEQSVDAVSVYPFT